MPKMTLLDMVQDILSDIDSDEVNSISDTTESEQVVQIIKTTYENMMVTKYMPHLKGLMQLDSTNSSTPSHMKMPDDVMELVTVNYDVHTSAQTDTKYKNMRYMEDTDFLEYTNARTTDNASVDLITDFSGAKLKIVTNTAPQYWTSFDDEYLVFDSYDSSLESNLQNSKSQVVAYREPSLTLVDATIPDLPSEAFPYLLSEAKRHCMAKLQQVSTTDTAYREELIRNRKQSSFLQRKKWRAHTQSKYPNYGRS
jgi:hypothetical protein